MQGDLRNPARWGFYLLGMLSLAAGITLNSMTGLGASAIVSVPFTLSRGMGWNFADLTLIVYILFVAAQFFILGRRSSWLFLLQIPLSIAFTRVMNAIQALIPYQSGNLFADLALLAAAIVCTGVGAAMTVDMALVPNPGDGIVSSIARRSGRELGLTKNIFDLCCVAISLALGAAFGDVLTGVGLGTVLSMLGVGRVIALFNARFRLPMQRAAGLAQ